MQSFFFFLQSGAAAPGRRATSCHVAVERWRSDWLVSVLASLLAVAQEVEVNREFTATGYKADGSLLT